MSHFDDIDFLLWTESPKSVIGATIFILIAGGALWWAFSADSASRMKCEKHGETYVDSREDYTLCAQDGGTVVKR